jgi:hypothetical protein
MCRRGRTSRWRRRLLASGVGVVVVLAGLWLKHRVARYLVENLGFRTIVWEEGWGSGVAIDRYVTAIVDRWRQRTGQRVIYSAANARTAAVPRLLVSFPDGSSARPRRV